MSGRSNGLALAQIPRLTFTLEVKVIAEVLIVEVLIALILDRRRDRQKAKTENQNG